MDDKKKTIIVLDEAGNEKEAEILSAFTVKKYNKNYILYTLNEVDENEMVKIYASELIEKDNMYSLGAIESDEEWAAVKEVMKEVAKSEE
ncbi:MAG: DUF1292 domain-containing protein [Bacilli bacterium]|nr:DUF1292 domain-containing protein [Bacilli bacterium]MBQ6282762.1 DUF1292 domain-containing protein [Bacilli bacterium]